MTKPETELIILPQLDILISDITQPAIRPKLAGGGKPTALLL
jgi:hypothetical protein